MRVGRGFVAREFVARELSDATCLRKREISASAPESAPDSESLASQSRRSSTVPVRRRACASWRRIERVLESATTAQILLKPSIFRSPRAFLGATRHPDREAAEGSLL